MFEGDERGAIEANAMGAPRFLLPSQVCVCVRETQSGVSYGVSNSPRMHFTWVSVF